MDRSAEVPNAITRSVVAFVAIAAAAPSLFAQDAAPDVPASEDTAYTAGEYRVYTGSGAPASSGVGSAVSISSRATRPACHWPIRVSNWWCPT